jgi:TPR repeat protein
MHMSRLLTGALIAVTLHVSIATAGALEDGEAALQGGSFATALRLFQGLADKGDTQAQHWLGFMYYYGAGVPQNYTIAAKWYLNAAEQGYSFAQADLGLMYAGAKV